MTVAVVLAFTAAMCVIASCSPLSLSRQVRAFATAEGAFGSSADYLERTRVALITHGIVDPYLEELAAKVAAYRERRERDNRS